MAHQQFNINKRLMALLQNEAKAGQQMNACAKETTKLHNNIASVKETVQQQKRAFEKASALIQQRRKDLETLEALNEAVQEQVTAAKQRNDAIRDRLAEARQEHNQYKGCVRILCEATNMYVNSRELPSRIKGVSVSAGRDEWFPFDIAVGDLKGLSVLRNQFQYNSVHADKWQQLMQVGNPQNQAINNVTASSIIEIDLTSPQSQR
ncbi:hypothetical protein KR044_002986 [Drosophila immigrans]|nr:hypothetical protein KR044_002986 [Drosophila immigrans]